MNFDTKTIHAGEEPDKSTGAIAPILVRSKTFAQKFGVDAEFQYSRGKNPTKKMLEAKLAALDGAKHATVYSSGVAATAALFLTLNPGDHVLCCQEIYGGTYRLLEQVMSRYGITTDYVDFSSKKSILKGIKKETVYLFVETPTNPSQHIIDLELVSQVSKEIGIPFVVDATFSPPCTTKPIEYGAKVVIHSLSKYIAGHNDVLAGALVTNDDALFEQCYFMMKTLGAVLSPDECYRVLQGVKTLSMRWDKVSKSAQQVAEFLSRFKAVKNVYYPGLPSHPNHHIAKTQMNNGFGGVVSFELQDEFHDTAHIKNFVDRVTRDSVIVYGESLASPETILAYPPLMSHKSLPQDVRFSLGITDGFFRLSLGFEDPNDIIDRLALGFIKI